MSTRYVFPELFYAAGAPIMVNERERLSLRWILHPSIGLPRALFQVWQFEGEIPPLTRTNVDQVLTRNGKMVSWPEGPSAIVKLSVSVPRTGSVVFSGFSAAKGTGHLVDQITIVGPVESHTVTLVGSPIASIAVEGFAFINENALVLPINDFVNDSGWKLVERIGLPASSPLFDATGYPLDIQGPVGAEVDPVEAAIRRVKDGTPDIGWLATTDRGTSMQTFVAPNPDVLVNNELRPLVETIAELLTLVPDPIEQARQDVQIVTTAPRSIHGIDGSQSWQARARPSTIKPLASMLLAAGSDPFAALGLGFGTTVDIAPQNITFAALGRPNGFFMITVQHFIQLEFGPTLTGTLRPTLDGDTGTLRPTLDGELAALYLGERPVLPALPTGVTATPSTTTTSAHPRLDPPGEIDGPWLEVVEVSWAAPVTPIAKMALPTGYVIARGAPSEPMEIRTEKRLSGGWTSFVSALSADSKQSTSVRFTESGVPEALPGDPTTLVYSVAAHDWFGRWSGWVSADHLRASIAPQIPAVQKIELSIEDTELPTHNASATIEFTWDWSHRRPDKIHLRVLVHADGTDPPDVPGSVLSVGGPTVDDQILDFSSASIDTPPVGVEAIPEEALGNNRKYRAEVNGIQLDFATHSKIRVTSRARAQERLAPAIRLSAWSPEVNTNAASRIPPPPPFVPSAMWWASVPDPRGVARTMLRWTNTAPMYAVYLADETALLRELNQPSPDLEISAADRLAPLRSLDIGHARRAFRRIAERVSTNSLEVELPRGSRLIHFYGVVPISSTGVEGSLPLSANSYFAVAAPVVKTPEVPKLVARDVGGEIALMVEVPEIRVLASRIEIFRAPSRHRAVSIEDAGPPIASVDASHGVRSDGLIRWVITDPTPGPAWQSIFYRAVAYGNTDRMRGEYGGKSLPSAAIEIVPSSLLQPQLADLKVEDVVSELNFRLVSFVSDVTLARTLRGTHAFAVQTVALDASVATRRVAADKLPLISTSMPTPIEQPDSIFRYDPVNPRTGRIFAWVPRVNGLGSSIIAVIVEVTDPTGRTTRETREIP